VNDRYSLVIADANHLHGMVILQKTIHVRRAEKFNSVSLKRPVESIHSRLPAEIFCKMLVAAMIISYEFCTSVLHCVASVSDYDERKETVGGS